MHVVKLPAGKIERIKKKGKKKGKKKEKKKGKEEKRERGDYRGASSILWPTTS